MVISNQWWPIGVGGLFVLALAHGFSSQNITKFKISLISICNKLSIMCTLPFYYYLISAFLKNTWVQQFIWSPHNGNTQNIPNENAAPLAGKIILTTTHCHHHHSPLQHNSITSIFLYAHFQKSETSNVFSSSLTMHVTIIPEAVSKLT